MNQHFLHTLNGGSYGELLTKHYLELLGCTVQINDSQTLDGRRKSDLIVTGKTTNPVEVKTQYATARTGNVALEHQSIKTHSAPYTIHLVPYFYLIKREDELELIQVYPPVPGGDDGRRQSLIPLDSPDFKEKFKLL